MLRRPARRAVAAPLGEALAEHLTDREIDAAGPPLPPGWPTRGRAARRRAGRLAGDPVAALLSAAPH